MNIKQKKIKIKPRIKLNYNIDTCYKMKLGKNLSPPP